MKKTYGKITVLICTLISAVMVLSALLFTYVQIDKINTGYMDKIHNAMLVTPREFETNSSNISATLNTYNFYKFSRSAINPNIGYYGRMQWKINGTEDWITMESTDYIDSLIILTGKDGEFELSQVPDRDKIVGISYCVFDDKGEVAYAISFPQEVNIVEVKTETKNTVVTDGLTEPKNDPLDQEAKRKYAELQDANNNTQNADFAEMGWFTSYVSYYSFSQLGNDSVRLDEWNTFVFHPFSIVIQNYGYIYILSLIVLAILLFLTIFLMHRMYVNRMNYEARTQNLTRCFAHELKTPLAVTKAYVENWDIVEEKDRPEVSAKINSEVDHMTRMVNTLLDLSKMDSGEVKLNLEDVELFDLTKVCFRHLEKIAEEEGVKVDFKKDNEDGGYSVSADLDMMRMVISNFLSNAIKYGKESVTVSLNATGNNVTFRITNDGEKINSKDLKKIWDLFYKKDKSGSDRLNSSGVGLAVNKSILDLHKAKYGVDSTDAGTTFWFEMKKAKE